MGLNRGPSWSGALGVFFHNLDSEMVIHIETGLLKFSYDATLERDKDRKTLGVLLPWGLPKVMENYTYLKMHTHKNIFL